ncbi:30S ribosomal protein S13 [Candidatus Berkelbacteria bacterium]|nr:30S ribosomal protein S13 [Candidatus Berkelbacteria bacterium]
MAEIKGATLRIAGVILPDTKPVGIALTYLFGVGHASAKSLLAQIAINPQLRVRDLSSEQVEKIRRTVEERFTLENQLRQEILTNIRRLKEISSYRGSRHAHNLPVRGQRTRTNARTKRGKKVTVGSGRKKSSEKT